MTKDLTEQWRNGELEDGDYYVKTRQGIIIIDYFDVDEFSYDTNHYVEQVLAQVPSYEELQNMNEAVNQAMAANIKLVEQNKQLKELLKEVLRHELSLKEISELSRKISQILGEEK